MVKSSTIVDFLLTIFLVHAILFYVHRTFEYVFRNKLSVYRPVGRIIRLLPIIA